MGNAKDLKEIGGIKLEDYIKILILLFVDDVLLFGKGNSQEWRKLWELVNLLCRATGMLVSPRKSFFLYNEIQ